MSDLRERVAEAIATYVFGDSRTLGFVADAAITAVIEALAAEAEEQADQGEGWLTGHKIADWLRAHLDAGRDGEAGT